MAVLIPLHVGCTDTSTLSQSIRSHADNRAGNADQGGGLAIASRASDLADLVAQEILDIGVLVLDSQVVGGGRGNAGQTTGHDVVVCGQNNMFGKVLGLVCGFNQYTRSQNFPKTITGMAYWCWHNRWEDASRSCRR